MARKLRPVPSVDRTRQALRDVRERLGTEARARRDGRRSTNPRGDQDQPDRPR